MKVQILWSLCMHLLLQDSRCVQQSCRKYPDMLYFYPNYFKANEICEKAIKKLCFTVIHVPNQ